MWIVYYDYWHYYLDRWFLTASFYLVGSDAGLPDAAPEIVGWCQLHDDDDERAPLGGPHAKNILLVGDEISGAWICVHMHAL